MSNASQLLLLADHIKLSLLERQRAISLNLEPNPSQDSNISRSLESLREGVESLSARSSDTEQLATIRSQYNDLSKQFHGDSSSTIADTLKSPNDPSLQDDFEHARTRSSLEQPGKPKRSSSMRGKDAAAAAKNVRFRDDPSQESLNDDDDANRASLFPQRYTDEPEAPDPTEGLNNQQIHAYHQQVLQEQDDQLDTLSESIGRQRQLAMQVGDELEGQVALLDEVDRGVDRHQSRLDGAKNRLKGVSQKAKQNWGMTTVSLIFLSFRPTSTDHLVAAASYQCRRSIVHALSFV
jgi:syntaxin 8